MRGLLELAGVAFALLLVRLLPMWLIAPVAGAFADGAYRLLARRRRLAVANVGSALGLADDRKAAARLVRSSFRSLALTAIPEVVKLHRRLTAGGAGEWVRRRSPEAAPLLDQARALHEASGGCVFVTPHLGNWELLPYLAAAAGIPLAVLVRPLDNRHLERLLARARDRTGQLFVPRRSSLLLLERHLARGRSVAILADQSTVRGLEVEFFGRPALTTPLPALLALRRARPIVVVACLRTGRLRFAGFVGKPIWPREGGGERAEVERLTREMVRAMEAVVRRYPGQYLWMHDRWKRYGGRAAGAAFDGMASGSPLA